MKLHSPERKALKDCVVDQQLVSIWQSVSYLPCPTTLDKYLRLFGLISQMLRNYYHKVFCSFHRPFYSTELGVSDIEKDFAVLLTFTNEIIHECRKYCLTRKERRAISRLIEKNERTWARFDQALARIRVGNDDLFWEEIVDYLPDKMPKGDNKDFTVVDFKKHKFLMN